jgi:hypothetical protein
MRSTAMADTLGMPYNTEDVYSDFANQLKLQLEIATLRKTINELLSSAHPNERDHPTMWKAWRNAEEVIGKAEGK